MLPPEAHIAHRGSQPHPVTPAAICRLQLGEEPRARGRVARPAKGDSQGDAGLDARRRLIGGLGQPDREQGIRRSSRSVLRPPLRDDAGEYLGQAIRDLLARVPQHDLCRGGERHRIHLESGVERPGGEAHLVRGPSRPGALQGVCEDPPDRAGPQHRETAVHHLGVEGMGKAHVRAAAVALHAHERPRLEPFDRRRPCERSYDTERQNAGDCQ